MSVYKLYQICLSSLLKNPIKNDEDFSQLPRTCLHDILPYLSPSELERLDWIYQQRCIPVNDLWRRHFELIWSLSRDDKEIYESHFHVPYKRLYFEYLFHDTQILQLGIYAHISQLNLSKSIIHLSFIEHIQYDLTRDSIIYCSKRRITDENQNLILIWNHRWNHYIKRYLIDLIEFAHIFLEFSFILVPHIWNSMKIDPLLIECFTLNVTDLVLSGYPTENDSQGMKFILDVLAHGHITNLVLKFPSYCLMNILLPLLIYPRTYSLSYYSLLYENQSNLFTLTRQRKFCVQVELDPNEEDNHSTDSLFIPIQTHLSTQSSATELGQNFVQIPSDSFFQTDLQTIQSSHFLSVSNQPANRSNLQPYELLLPYLNRSRTLQPHSTFASVITPIRHLSASEQTVPSTNLFSDIHSSSDSNVFHRHTTAPTTISSIASIHENLDENKSLLLHLTPQYQINSLTTLSIYYVSSFETIEMVAIALLGMHQIQHLTLVNFALYSSQLETSLVTLCTRSQLESLQLTSISFTDGAIGFLLGLFQKKSNEIDTNLNLKRLRLDSIKTFSITTDHIHLSDLEQIEFIQNSSLEQFFWRERHMQYIHMRFLYRLLPNITSNLRRLDLSSILECIVFDQFVWCQTFLHHISDIRLRNFRLRPLNLARFFFALNTPCILTVLHFERVGLTWNNHDQQATIIADAFTSLILNAKHLKELSLAYNNLSESFIQWLCRILLSNDENIQQKTKSWWSIVILNLTFNLISSESMRRLFETLKEYRERWRLRYAPIRRIDILGNALEMREIPNLKKQFHEIGCDLISYILS